jgi:hypothetical protein
VPRAGQNSGVFNLGAGELVMLGLLGLIFFGPKRLPDASEGLREAIENLRERRIMAPRWSWSDWMLVGAALLSTAVALALLAGPSP